MTDLHLSGDQNRLIWQHLSLIREALHDVRDVAIHHGLIGCGDLSRRLASDQDRAFRAVTAIAGVLENAAEQMEGRV